MATSLAKTFKPASGVDFITPVTARFSGIATVSYSDTITLINETLTESIKLVSTVFSGDGQGEFVFYINGVQWSPKMRNAWNDRQVGLSFNGKLLNIGDTLKVDVTNIEISEDDAEYESFIYYGEVTA